MNKKKLNITDIFEAKNPKQDKQAYKLTMLTAYDATSAKLAERAGVDLILVGDSLAMTMQGANDTNAVSLEEIIYHTKIVVANAPNTLVVADMPFMSYEIGVEQALSNAGRLFRESGVRALKLEGGKNILPQVKALVQAGIPVMGHLGLTPQRANMFGGFKAQAKTANSALELLQDAKYLEEAGCFSLVLEAIPSMVAQVVSQSIKIPTIGIGAGNTCDGQVLVFHDVLGLSDHTPRFVKKYANLAQPIQEALKNYIYEVQNEQFPMEEHTFTMPTTELETFLTSISKK